MGSWFSNLHVRKTEEITRERVCSCIKDTLTANKYTFVDCAEDADVSVAVLTAQNSNWITICSKTHAHDDPDSCKSIASPLSAQLHTDVMGIACFDSDYLYLNLINADESVDAWIGIGAGKEIGITRRNNVTAWKKKVTDYPTFSAAVKGTYVCADEFLFEAESCLGLPAEQGGISLDYLSDTSLQIDTMFLHFRQEEAASATGPNLRIWNINYTFPCFDGKENKISFFNAGDAFRGFSIYFLGPYVEYEEIVFSDVRLEKYYLQPLMELTLEKIKLPSGEWAYHCHIPDLLMPEGVQGRMKYAKRYKLELERVHSLCFVPRGNPYKMLDITILIVSDENPDNRAEWNIWHQHGSKEAFIKWHNKTWKLLRAYETDPNQLLPLLKLEDFVE